MDILSIIGTALSIIFSALISYGFKVIIEERKKKEKLEEKVNAMSNTAKLLEQEFENHKEDNAKEFKQIMSNISEIRKEHNELNKKHLTCSKAREIHEEGTNKTLESFLKSFDQFCIKFDEIYRFMIKNNKE